jgi:hypothetical protein
MAAKTLFTVLLVAVAGTVLAAPAVADVSVRMYDNPKCYIKYQKCCEKKEPKYETCYEKKCEKKQVCDQYGGKGKDGGDHYGGKGKGGGGKHGGSYRTAEEAAAAGGEAVDSSVKTYGRGGCREVETCAHHPRQCHKGGYYTKHECHEYKHKECDHDWCNYL